jgi:hypothetical protein
MNTPWLRGRRFLLAAGVFLAASGTWGTGAVQDSYKVMKMTETMKTVCVGRLLIDVPSEAEVELQQAWIDGFDVSAYAEDLERYRARVVAREAEIRATPDRFGGAGNLESAKDVDSGNGMHGRILVHGRTVTEGTAGYSLDSLEHYRYENVALEAHLHHRGISITLSADAYDPDLMQNLPRLAAQIVANPDRRTPAEPGFCIDRAFIRDPLKAEQGERIVMRASFPSRPDVHLRFDTMAGTKPDSESLLERHARVHAAAARALGMRFASLRAAPRMIGGLIGDELVERVVEENFAVIFGFRWEVLGTQDDVFVPNLTLTMRTGASRDGPVPSSLSEPAALALWDRIASSIRVRRASPMRQPPR